MNACDLKGKAIVFLGDGMADLPIPELGGKTPLEAVPTPTMDKIAANGASGTFLTLPEGYPTSSDVANMSVLGYGVVSDVLTRAGEAVENRSFAAVRIPGQDDPVFAAHGRSCLRMMMFAASSR